MTDHENAEGLLEDWHRRFYILQNCHYEVARVHRRRNYYLGVPVALLTVFVGGSIFAALQAEVSASAQMLVGLLSFSAAGLSAIQTFLGYAERAEKNRVAAAHYGSLRRWIEQERALPTTDEAELKDTVTKIRELSDRYATESPEIPAGVFDAWRRKEKRRNQAGATGLAKKS